MDALFKDWVALASLLSAVGALIIMVVAGIKLKKLMNSTHSED